MSPAQPQRTLKDQAKKRKPKKMYKRPKEEYEEIYKYVRYQIHRTVPNKILKSKQIQSMG